MTLLADRFELRGVLGAGGMATVYNAWDREQQVECAIKVLATGFAQRPLLRKRFLLEARTMMRLEHPNIVGVSEVGEDDRRPFMVMEMVDGGTLIDRVERAGPVHPATAVRAIQDLLQALDHAHGLGVVHRDVKPHNILTRPNGRAVLTDFGIAQVQDESSSTRTGAMMGTPAYMAPEQHTSARRADARSDIYSAGATLFHLVTGQTPKKLYADDLAAVDPGLRAVLLGATSFDPAGRYPTATAMLEALEALELEPAPEGDTLYIPRDPPRSLPGDLPRAAPTPGQNAPQHVSSPDLAGSGLTEFRPARTGPTLLTALLAIGFVVGMLLLIQQMAESPAPPPPLAAEPAPVEPPPPLVEAPAEVEPEVETEVETEVEPEVQVEPEVEAEPVAAPVKAPPRGTVVVEGEVDSLTLVGEAGTFSPGAVPAGTYAAQARFGDRSVSLPGVVVLAGGTTTLRCDRTFRRCRVE